MRFSKYLQQIMDRFGYTRQTFSLEIGISYHTLASWLYGSRMPNLHQFLDLVDAICRISKFTQPATQKKILTMIRLDRIDQGKK